MNAGVEPCRMMTYNAAFRGIICKLELHLVDKIRV